MVIHFTAVGAVLRDSSQYSLTNVPPFEETFQKILPLAASRGLRLIVLHRRDYAPTTLFSDTELQELKSDDPTIRDRFLHDRGMEIALFTCNVIKALELPPLTKDGQNGGVAWLGWSYGNAVTISTVVAALSLSANLKALLQSYLRGLIIYGNATPIISNAHLQ